MDKELKEIFDELNQTASEIHNLKDILKRKFKREFTGNKAQRIKEARRQDAGSDS